MSDAGHYRADVQGLRGVAVLLVVAFHAWPALLPGGYIGVDVFFVVSGYLITRLLSKELDATGRIDFKAFYARRIRRLLPAAALVIATTAVLALRYRSPLEAKDFASTAVAAILYLSNVWFAALSVDYLQEGLQRNLLLHTWSLGVEEQFYLLWPALLAASALVFRRAGRPGALAWTVGVVSMLSFAACVWLTFTVQSWAFFGLPTRAWELGAGAAAALLEGRERTLGVPVRRAMVLAGLAGLLTAAFAFSGDTRFPGYAALLPVCGALLIISGGGADGSSGASGALQLGLLQRLGDLSYSWYLWHWPTLILVADLWPSADRSLVAAAGVALSLGLARLTFLFVEDPVRRNEKLRAHPARTYALALMLTASTVAVVGAALFAGTGSHLTDPRRKLEQAARDRPALYDDRCFAAALDTEPPACLYGAAKGTHTVVLIGDSHAAQWFPALERLALVHGWRLAVFVKAACPLAVVDLFDPKLNRPYVECTQWRERAMQRIAEMRPSLVFAASSSFYEPFLSRDRPAIERWQKGLDESLRRLEQSIEHVLLIRDTPRPGFHVPGCLARAWKQGGSPATDCAFSLPDSMLGSAHEVELAAAAARSRVSVIDLTDRICPSASCRTERDGVVLFHDSQHLSATFARHLAEPLWQRLPAAARAALAR